MLTYVSEIEGEVKQSNSGQGEILANNKHDLGVTNQVERRAI
jgi:hypothetical protein